MSHAVYRHFDTNDKLLYVGLSSNPSSRLNGHKRFSGWFGLIAKVTIEKCQSKAAAKARERAIVRRERPLFNKIIFKIKERTRKRLLIEKKPSSLPSDALAQFRKWGAEGGRRKAKKYSTKQISDMAKRGKRRKRRNGA